MKKSSIFKCTGGDDLEGHVGFIGAAFVRLGVEDFVAGMLACASGGECNIFGGSKGNVLEGLKVGSAIKTSLILSSIACRQADGNGRVVSPAHQAKFMRLFQELWIVKNGFKYILVAGSIAITL